MPTVDINKIPCRFRTRFSPTIYNDHVYDTSDNVDRLTYVDPVLQISNMQKMGVNYALQKGQTLIDDAFDPLQDEYRFTTPVYAEDRVDMDKKIEMYKKARAAVGNAVEKQKYKEAMEAKLKESTESIEKRSIEDSSEKVE